MSGLRGHLNLDFIRQKILDNQFTGLLIFVLLFSLGNLMQIPGIVFLAAAVLALGQLYGGVATYIAAVISCVVIFVVIRAIGGNALRELDNKFAVKILARLNAQTYHQYHPAAHIVSDCTGAELHAGHVRGQVSGLSDRDGAGVASAYFFTVLVFLRS